MRTARQSANPSDPRSYAALVEKVCETGVLGARYRDVVVRQPAHDRIARELAPALRASALGYFGHMWELYAMWAWIAAAGVVPFVADHSGLREAGALVGKGLPFDLRIGMDHFEENIAGALAGFLSLSPEERGDHSETVRRNSVETLGWGTLAEKVAGIFVMTNEASGHSGGGSGMTSR